MVLTGFAKSAAWTCD